MKFFIHINSAALDTKVLPQTKTISKKKYIDGIIFSSIKNTKENLINMVKNSNPKDILLDPQIYTLEKTENFKNEHYKDLFDIEEKDTPKDIINKVIDINSKADIKKIVTPNLYLNNADTWTSSHFKTFIEFIKFSNERGLDLYPSIILNYKVLLKMPDFLIEEILNNTNSSIKGFYILIGSNKGSFLLDSSLNNPDILSNLMLLNYVFSKKEGFQIINGCSDILSIFLNFSNNFIGATGSSSKFRVFNIENYKEEEKKLDGSPIKKHYNPANMRYLSRKTICRLKYTELLQNINQGKMTYNNLSPDSLLKNETSEKEASKHEIQQIFKTLKYLSNKTKTLETKEKTLNESISFIENNLKSKGFTGVRNQLKFLKNIRSGIIKFKIKAQI